MVRKLDERARYVAELAPNICHEFKSPLTSHPRRRRAAARGRRRGSRRARPLPRNILQDATASTASSPASSSCRASRRRSSTATTSSSASCIGEVAARFAEGGVTVEPAGAIALRANRAHLDSVLQALLENAVRYSPPGRPARVRAEAADGAVRLRVSDDGPGISPANQAKIFNRFFTTDAARGGTGLGLAIVATVVRAHGGTVTVESAPGRGSTFEVCLSSGRDGERR